MKHLQSAIKTQNVRTLYTRVISEKQESGRSMVEILGVLAIIGILSIIGIAGYMSAMNKHRANEVLNEANKRAAVVAIQAATGKRGTVSLAEFDTEPVAGATFGSDAVIENKQIKLTVSNVSEKVCTQMKIAAGANSIMNIEEDCGSDPLTIAFNEDMSKGVKFSFSNMWEPQECGGDGDCGECEVCDNGWCLKVSNGTDCKCSSREMLTDWNGDGSLMTCIPCNFYDMVYGVSSSECSKCYNRSYDQSEGKGICLISSCPNNYWRDEEYNECVSCDVPWEIYIDEFPNNIETACPNRTIITDEEEERVSVFRECSSGSVMGTSGFCIPCDMSSGMSFTTTRSECAKCSNRDFSVSSSGGGSVTMSVGTMGWTPPTSPDDDIGDCYLRSCDSGYFRDEDAWQCVSCGINRPVTVADESECNKCSGREYVQVIPSNGGGSVSEKSVGTMAISDDSVYKCVKKCSSGYVRDIYGNCQSCNSSDDIEVESSTVCTSSCSNRAYNSGYCYLASCSGNNFKSVWGCTPCDILEAYEVYSESDCTCSNREFVAKTSGGDSSTVMSVGTMAVSMPSGSGYCALKNCPRGYKKDLDGSCVSACSAGSQWDDSTSSCVCIEGYMKDSEGNCRSCSDENIFVPESESDCTNRCSERALISGQCYPRCYDWQMRASDGSCQSCDGKSAFTPYNAQECGTRCADRGMKDGLCYYKCWSTSYISTESGSCVDCNYNYNFVPYNPADCARCSNREMVGNECRKKCNSGEIRNSNKDCVSCSNNYRFEPYIASECTSKCTGREMQGDYCVLTECLSGYIKDSDGNCISCTSTSSFTPQNANDCTNVCTNRGMKDGQCYYKCDSGKVKDSSGNCRLCSYSYYFTPYNDADCTDRCSTTRELVNGKCVPKCVSGKINSSTGYCSACPTTQSVDVLNSTDCTSKCSNTFLQGNTCYPVCNSGYLLSSAGACTLCGKIATPLNMEDCTLRCSNTEVIGEGNLARCLPKCDSGYVRDVYKTCQSCNSIAIELTLYNSADCSRCSNRELVNGKCVKK